MVNKTSCNQYIFFRICPTIIYNNYLNIKIFRKKIAEPHANDELFFKINDHYGLEKASLYTDNNFYFDWNNYEHILIFCYQHKRIMNIIEKDLEPSPRIINAKLIQTVYINTNITNKYDIFGEPIDTMKKSFNIYKEIEGKKINENYLIRIYGKYAIKKNDYERINQSIDKILDGIYFEEPKIYDFIISS